MKGLKILKREMLKIEDNGHSFLGIDGGNINSDVWVCAVEFGSDIWGMEEYYSRYNKTQVVNGYDVPFRTTCPKTFLTSPFDRFLSAFYINLLNDKTINTPVDTAIIEKVLKDELYSENSKTFKLNLFPIAKSDIGWSATIESELGISKDAYYGSLFNKRSMFFKELVNEFKPKLIICTSPKGYKEYFIEAFLNGNENINYSWEYLTLRGKNFKISVFDNKKTKIVIIPFLGRGNLSSYDDVLSMANHLRKKYL